KLENDSIIEEEDWSFTSEDINAQTSNLESNGTYIMVEELNKEVSSTFEDESFLVELKNEIERLLNFSLEKGIEISLNGQILDKKGIVLFNDNSKPYFYEDSFGDVKFKV